MGEKFKSKETREKISKTLKEYFKDKTNHPMLGKNHSEETKQKLSQFFKEYFKKHKSPNLGRHHTEEAKKKMSLFQKRKTLSDEHKKKIGESLKKWNKEVGMPPEIRKRIAEKQRGKRLSKETKRKISEANKGNVSWMKGLTKKDPRVK